MTPFFSFNQSKNSSKDFETLIGQLRLVPESNWNWGRREPILKFLESYMNSTNTKALRVPIHRENRYWTGLKVTIEESVYIYFDEIIFSPGQAPIIEWFQLEKIDTSWGPNIYKTILLLASDDNAKTKGGAILSFFDDSKIYDQYKLPLQ